MSEIFNEIKEGLEQAIAYEKCELADVNVHSRPEKRRDRNYRRAKALQKKKRLLKIVNLKGYNPARGYVDWGMETGQWKPVGNHIKYPKNSNKQRFYKRYTKRIVRRNELPRKGNGYRKCFDYWWALD